MSDPDNDVLDLFAGKRGWSRCWTENHHDVVTLDNDTDGSFQSTFVRDILTVTDIAELERGWGPFRVILASPPCTAFSVAAMGKNWERSSRGTIAGPKPDDGTPAGRRAHERAVLGMCIAEHTFRLIDAYVARHPDTLYIIENPIGALRVMPFAIDRTDRRSTWYCRWDDRRPGIALPRAKPTDLWTNIPGLDLPMCRPGAADHESAPRGARTGTQGIKTAADRSLIPPKLAEAVMAACCMAAR